MTNRENENSVSPYNIKMGNEESTGAPFSQSSVGRKHKHQELHYFHTKRPQSHELKKPVCSTFR